MSEPTGWLAKLRSGLARSSDRLGGNLSGLFGTATLDQDRLDAIEEALIASDLGPALSGRIVAQLAPEKYPRGIDEAGVRAVVAAEVAKVLQPVARPLEVVAFPRPQVILVVGVNGSGKTTTIAKLAHLFAEQDYSVMLAAGDTFRAAAIEQLKIWARGRTCPWSPGSRAPTPPGSPSPRWKRRGRPAATSSSSTPPGGCRTRRA